MRPTSFLVPLGRLRRVGPPGRSWLVPFLAATLGLSLWLGFEALSATRQQRETAEYTLRDYGQMAAWQYSWVAEEELEDLLDILFDDVPNRRDTRPLSGPRIVQRRIDRALRNLDDCACPGLRNPYIFRVDVMEPAVVLWRDTAPAGFRRQLADVISRRVVATGSRRNDGLFTVPAGELLDVPAAIAYAITEARVPPPGVELREGRFQDDEDWPEQVRAVYGVVTPATEFGVLFDLWADESTLLPEAMTGDMPNDSLLHIAVYDLDGAPLYEPSADFAADLVARDTIRDGFGPLVIEASVRPDAAGQLIIGGLPKSRLPLILGLLILTLGVGAAALVQLRRERQLARLRDDFISGVSHELRTPLAQIRVFAELQQAGKLRSDVDRARAVSVINRESQRLTHLVENILRYSRLRHTAGRTLVTEDIPVQATLNDLLDSFRPLARSRGMDIDVDCEPGLVLTANREALNQILVNLLDNAVKYGPAGQTITVSARADGEIARIVVEDEGPGVPAADRPRIWEPYVRLEREMDLRRPGTGIGLAVVAQLTAAHGGHVRVEDGHSTGARFVVELPGARIQHLPRLPGAPSTEIPA